MAAPFIFRANDPAPDLTENVAILRLENNKVVQLDPTVLPPPKKGQTSKPADCPEAAVARLLQQDRSVFRWRYFTREAISRQLSAISQSKARSVAGARRNGLSRAA